MASFDSLETDRPIADVDEDRLERRNFAAHVAKMLVRNANEDPIVVGLYGPWGSGKTSILNLITKEIQGGNDVAVVHFNPWYFTGESQLLEKFFEELAAALGGKAVPARQEAANALRKYLGVLKPAIKVASFAADALLPGAGMAARVITEVAAPAVEGLTTVADPVADALKREVSLEDTRKVVSDKLRAANVRIVVLIDDIDRLYPDDIRMVFKLVRLVGDLPRVSYLLSFDPDVVALSLTRADNEENAISKGYAYLEKIVQVAVPLPKARREDLRKAAFEGVVGILKRNGVEVTQDELQRLASGWGLGIERNVRTIRQVKRVLNAANFAVGLLKDEVNVVDLVLLEALRIVFPRIVDAISAEPQWVLSESKRSGEKGRRPLDLELGKIPEAERHGVCELLQLLFPRLKENYSYSDSYDVQWRQEKRISSEEHLEKALGYGIPAGIISDAVYGEMMSVLRAFASKDDTRFLLLLNELVRRNGWSDLIWRFRQDRNSLPEPAAYQLAMLVAQRASELSSSDGLMNGVTSGVRNSTLFIKEVLFHAKEPSEAKNFAAELIKRSATIHFAALVLQRMDDAEKDNGALHSGWEEVVSAAKSAFKDRVAAELDLSKAVGVWDKDVLFNVLYGWRKSAGYQLVESVFEQWFAKEPLGAKRLVAVAIPPIPQDDFRSPLRRIRVETGYGNLRAIVTPAFLVRALGYDIGKPLGKDDLDKAPALPHLEQAALLFVDMHQMYLKVESGQS